MAENIIRKVAVEKLGYNFIKTPYLPKGKDEYYLRNLQNRSGIDYRNLTAYEIEALVRNRNTSGSQPDRSNSGSAFLHLRLDFRFDRLAHYLIGE